ncbi:hypothetical protein L7F22_064474 [Adiantum nelumboides]|nr:hypothetical protein [Adiantum nelumboides]
MESDECSTDLDMVRLDRNQACTSSSPSSPRVDKVDVISMSDFDLEDCIKRYRRHLKDFTMKDDNAKLRHRLGLYEDELARRQSLRQTGNEVIPVEAVESHHSEPNSAKQKPEVLDLEIESSISVWHLPTTSPKKGYFSIAVDCDKEDVMPFTDVMKEEVANEIHDIDKSSAVVKVCSSCDKFLTSPSIEVDGCFHCSCCKKEIVSPPDNCFTSVNGLITRPNESSGSAKRSQQAIGDTPDTALELSDDEESKEVTHGESSTTGNLLKRKCMRNASEKMADRRMADAKLLYPSSCDPEAVEVRYPDLCHLAPTEFLNDTVIDFYMKYMQVNLLEEKDRLHRFHFFSCFFYKKLTSSKAQGRDRFEKLHKWTKGINIFKKEYLFIPIHNSCHWSLAVVCFPVGQRVPLILHLDSMSSTAGHPSLFIYSVIKSYLTAERKYLRQHQDCLEEIIIDPSKAITKRKQVPLQDNEWDCGLFMLYYMQKFVTEVDAKGFDNLFGRDWFKPSEASELRGTILNILESIFIGRASEPCLVAES